MELGLEGATLGCRAISGLDGLDVDKVGADLGEQIVQHLNVAMVCRSTDNVASNAVETTLAQTDMADVKQAAAALH